MNLNNNFFGPPVYRYLLIYIADYSRISLISKMLRIGLKAHNHYHNGYVIMTGNDTNGP